MGKTKASNNAGSLASLKKMAKEYGIEKNALFVSLINQYALQFAVIKNMKESLKSESMTTEKTYIKGQSNAYASPLVRELPKHSDALNRTAGMILDVILKLGRKPAPKGKLDKFLGDD